MTTDCKRGLVVGAALTAAAFYLTTFVVAFAIFFGEKCNSQPRCTSPAIEAAR